MDDKQDKKKRRRLKISNLDFLRLESGEETQLI